MIKVYTKDNCSYCVKAKQFLNNRAIPFEEVSIASIGREALIEQFPLARTAPVISINGQYIGGYSDLVELYQENNTELLCE